MIHVGDCLEVMRRLEAGSVQTCVTSPPYFGLRDYGHDGQIGLEATPDAFVGKLVEVFREVKRLLRDDGTLWLNLGDSYNAYNGNRGQSESLDRERDAEARPKLAKGAGLTTSSLKNKDLIGIPWRVAFALQADGWYLRQDIIWSKPNPMPESVRDRCTKAHEYLFLLSKSPRYHFDAEAISEPLAESSIERLGQPTLDQQAGSDRVPGKTNGAMKAVGPRFGGTKYGDDDSDESRTKSGNEWAGNEAGRRNKRSVWNVATKPFREAHFATFPEELIEPCILAGARAGDVVLDPFMGAGTTAVVASRLGRRFVGAELNPEYAAIAERRLRDNQPGLPLGAAA